MFCVLAVFEWGCVLNFNFCCVFGFVDDEVVNLFVVLGFGFDVHWFFWL